MYSLPVFKLSFWEFWNSVTESAGISPHDAMCQLCADIPHAIPTFEEAFRMARANRVGTDWEILQMLYNGWSTILKREHFYNGTKLDCGEYFCKCESFCCDVERGIFMMEVTSFVDRLCRKIPDEAPRDSVQGKPVSVEKPEISNLWDML